MNMKYLQGKRNFQLEVKEKPVPIPGGNQVLVQVQACGVCGSDLNLLRHSEEFMPLGHEISAQVIEIGPSVTKVQAGDKVVVEDQTACGTCSYCKNGETCFCSSMYSLEGQSGMGEYLCVHENMLVPYEGLDAFEATFVEPLAVCINTYRASGLPMNGNLVIWGLGPLALMCVGLAKRFNTGKVICIGSKKGSVKNDVREKAALSLGADCVLYASDADLDRKIKDRACGRIDAAIVTSPPKTLPEAIETASYGATIVPIGLDMGKNSSVWLDIDQLIFGKKKIVTVLAEPARNFPLSIELIKNQVIPVKKLLTHKIRLTDTEQFQKVFSEDSGVIKAIVINNAE